MAGKLFGQGEAARLAEAKLAAEEGPRIAERWTFACVLMLKGAEGLAGVRVVLVMAINLEF